MTCTSIVYNNKIYNIDKFINCILYSNMNAKKSPICEITEQSDCYLISLTPFYNSVNYFEVYYKNRFLILQIKRKKPSSKTLSTKLFYLPNINTKKISHIYYNDSLSLKVPKIYFNNS